MSASRSAAPRSTPPSGRTYARINPITGEPATHAAAASVADAQAAADAAAAAFPAWSATGPNARRALLNKAAAALEARGDDFVAAMMTETGSTEGWARFNLMLAAGMVREAAALTTQIGGEVIPSDKPGCSRWRLREPVGVILGIAPWNAPIILGVPRDRGAARLRQHASSSRRPRRCPRTHALIVEAFAEAGFPARRRQSRHQRARGCRRSRRRADRPSGGPADQFHRLDRGRPDHRQARRRASEAGAARARRQGAADRARGRRPRRGGEGRRVRRLHEPGPDLHVDRADHRRRGDRRRLRREVRREGRRRMPAAIRATARRRSARWSTRRRSITSTR